MQSGPSKYDAAVSEKLVINFMQPYRFKTKFTMFRKFMDRDLPFYGSISIDGSASILSDKCLDTVVMTCTRTCLTHSANVHIKHADNS